MILNFVQLSFINPQVKAASAASTILEGFHLMSPLPTSNMQQQSEITWIPSNGGGGGGRGEEAARGGRVLEGQGLSLSLSTSLRNLEANNKFEKINMGNGELYFPNSYGLDDVGTNHQLLFSSPRLVSDHDNQIHFGYVESARTMNSLRNSKYLKATQELLLEFCYVGRGQFKNHKIKKQDRNPNSASDNGAGSGSGATASSSKEHPSLSPSERTENQRRKTRLLSMLDEVSLSLSLSYTLHM